MTDRSPVDEVPQLEDHGMTLDEYQIKARSTGGLVDAIHPLAYATLGLTNEAGEFAGKVKKVFRDHDGNLSEQLHQSLVAELGDVLWYLAEISSELDIKLSAAANMNLEKLRDRVERGVLFGTGDDR